MTLEQQTPERPDPIPMVSQRPEVWMPHGVSPTIDRDAATTPEPASMQVAPGRMVNLRFLRTALRRQRWMWLTAAILGLAIGGVYHVVVPMKYAATSTIYLTHPSGGDATVEAQNDLAMLDTSAVAKRAATLLGEHDLSPTGLLGKEPGTLASDNILAITIEASSPEEALRRVDAVADAYLSFRSQEYEAQNRSIVAGTTAQVQKLRAQLTALSSKIAALGTRTPSEVTSLEGETAVATSQITSLEASIQQDDLNTLTVTSGTKILTRGTPVVTSKKKVFGLDALTGLAGGLAGGLLVVVLLAVLSDRPRSREDIAALLDAPVHLSVGRVGRRRYIRRRTARAIASSRDPQLRVLVHYLRGRLELPGAPRTQSVVAVDDVDAPAAAVIVLSRLLASSGQRVVMVDATNSRALGRALGHADVGFHTVDVPGGSAAVGLVVPPRPWEGAEDDPRRFDLAALPDADAVLVLATVDPAVGAWALRSWGQHAIVTVTAGDSTAQRICVVAELLEAAGVSVVSAVLLDADATDESVGLPIREVLSSHQQLGLVPTAHALLT